MHLEMVFDVLCVNVLQLIFTFKMTAVCMKSNFIKGLNAVAQELTVIL